MTQLSARLVAVSHMGPEIRAREAECRIRSLIFHDPSSFPIIVSAHANEFAAARVGYSARSL
jgi:hypothetical protein